MDSFVISGAPASISTRSDTAVSKPAVFHSETKRRLQLEVQNKRKNGNFLKGQRKNALKKRELQMKEVKKQQSIEELRVTIPSIGIVQSNIQNDRSSPSSSELSGSTENGSLDEKEIQGRFSGASSPWYKMMMSSNDEDDHLETNHSERKKKFLPKINVQDKGNHRNGMKHKIDNSVEEYTCPSSACSFGSRDSKSPSQTKSFARIEPYVQVTPDNVKKRMQVKLGRTKSPETLIGTENNINGNEELISNEWTNPTEHPYENQNDNSWNKKEERMNNHESRNDGRRSISSRGTPYDYAEIYSNALKLNDSMNPEIALDNIQIHGENQIADVVNSRESYTDDEHVIDENVCENEEQHDSENPAENKDSSSSNSEIDIQNRLEEEIKHCLKDKNDLEEDLLENEKRPFSQKSIEYNSGTRSSMENDLVQERPLYREISAPTEELDVQEKGEKVAKPSSTSLALSRQSRPSSCSLPVSCCSSRMSNAEINENDAKLSQATHSVIIPEHSNEFGSYGDILNVLERIEKETSESEHDVEKRKSALKQNDSSRSSSRRSSATYFTSTPRNNQKAMEGPDATENALNYDTILNEKHVRSSSKMSNLLSYLDNVENDTKNGRFTTTQNQSKENMRIAELALESSQSLAEQVVNLNYTVEEKERAVVVLKQALEHQRRLSASFSTRFQKELKQRLHTQKVEYEAAITRHQNFIDQLIDDKKGLSERVETQTGEMKVVEKKHKDAMKNAEQRHATEIKRLKALQESSNKIRQEKWVDEKTKRIKEQTVRGLEPEIQRLMARHTQEIADMEAERERQLANKERELYQRHLQHIRELKDDWEQEHQESLQRERHVLNQRHSQQQDDLAAQHAEEVERLHDQIRRERGRNTDERTHYEREAEQVRRIANERANAEISRIKEEEENKRKTLMKKHQNELATFNETEKADRNEWERIAQHKMEEEWKSREVTLKQKFKEERDEELDRAVARLEQEVTKGRKEVEQEYQERIRRLKEKYESEIEFTNDEVTMHKNKFNKLRDEYASKEEETIVLQAVVKTKEVQMAEMQKINERLENERDDIRTVVRGEFSSALDGLTEERSSLLNQLSDMRLKLAEAHSEQESSEKRWRCQAEEEAERIHAKIRSAIERKEEIIVELKKKYERVSDHCNHLETLLQRQTKENYMKDVKMTKNTRL